MEIRHTRSVGGIVIGDHGTIAMVQHKNSMGAWLFPKGHPDPGETDEEAARREVAEESGLNDLEILADLGSYERHPILPNGVEDPTEIKEIRMFLFNAQPGAQLLPTMEIGEAKWVPYAQVGSVCGNSADCVWFSSVYDRVRQAIQRD